MCRAVWVAVAGATEDACKILRRAAGADAQVVALVTSAAELLAEELRADVVVLDADLEGVGAAVGTLRARGAAVVWVGDAPPEQVHHAIAWNEVSDDVLPGAITKALIARGAAGRQT